ncbi:hypothetical protein [Flindersiella endophytica]
MPEQYDLFDRLLARDAGRRLDRTPARPRLPEVFQPGAFTEQPVEVTAAPPSARPERAERTGQEEPATSGEPPALVRLLRQEATHRIEQRERVVEPAPVAFPQIVERLTERVVERPGPRAPGPAGSPALVEVVRELDGGGEPPRPVAAPAERRWSSAGAPTEAGRRIGGEPSPVRHSAVARQEPVVQISIGRLEVTAAGSAGEAAKPAAAERPARPAATVSLDAFLARESGGGRG